ncbi:MAG: transketolase family protein [bacterium]
MKTAMISPRDAYGAALKRLGATHDNIVVLDADLSESTRTAKFRADFPHRFFNAGVAEQNMMGIAAGLAATGKIVFASTFAVFAAGRTYDQIRQGIARSNLNVRIVASHGGITVGEDGPSHQMTEDLALMRALPNMMVLVPADAVETEKMIEKSLEIQGPVYIRTSREKFPVIFDENHRFNPGKGTLLKDGAHLSIIAAGLMVSSALSAADMLAEHGIQASVVNMSSIKPIDRDLIVQCAEHTGRILTVEEHSVIGGLGSAVAEVVSEEFPVPVRRIGVTDQFCFSAPASALLEHFGLTAKHIYDFVRRWMD